MKLPKWLLTELQELSETAVKEVRQYIVAGLFLVLLAVLAVLWVHIRRLLISTLQVSVTHWQIQQILTFAVTFLLFTVSLSKFMAIIHRRQATKTEENEATERAGLNRSHYIESSQILDKSLFSDKPSLEEIRQRIEDQPAYSQSKFAESFIGLRIHWILSLLSVHPDEESTMVRMLFDYFVNGVVDSKEIPEIKLAKTNTPIEVWAEITWIAYPRIGLGIHMLQIKEL